MREDKHIPAQNQHQIRTVNKIKIDTYIYIYTCVCICFVHLMENMAIWPRSEKQSRREREREIPLPRKDLAEAETSKCAGDDEDQI